MQDRGPALSRFHLSAPESLYIRPAGDPSASRIIVDPESPASDRGGDSITIGRKAVEKTPDTLFSQDTQQSLLPLPHIARSISTDIGLSMSGGVSAALSPESLEMVKKLDRLGSEGFTFFKRTRPKFPFLKEHVEQISSLEVISGLGRSEVGKSLKMRSGHIDSLPITSKDEIKRLDEFYEQKEQRDYSEREALRQQLKNWESNRL